jgi:ubiquitin carboxyl-terminal hydrolase MINDY-1/2
MPPRPPPSVPALPVLVSLPAGESPTWDEREPPASMQELPSDPQQLHVNDEGVNVWEENETQVKLQNATLPAHQAAQEEYFRREGGVLESELPPQESGVVFNTDNAPEHRPILPARPLTEEKAPALPPRLLQDESAPEKPPRHVDTADSTSLAGPGSRGGARQQRKETYEIKKVAWYDATASSNPRISPILVQNANGPCPLLALVNALSLSTPAELSTALVETLRSREQVSLGLLLDAVFDELMSGRHGGAAQELPDVGDLYAFLVTLHTGMNVNPRFFSLAPTNLMNDPKLSMSYMYPNEQEASAGAFEDTREMKLYSTFNIPLIHGWLPAKDTPAYAALARSARSYEDAQNLMFREEELEDKLQNEGLSFEEQATLEDITTIRAFFTEYATQLTPHGLDTITHSMAPGSVAILFRNDHFSTLYRHPESHQLLHLVTDMGYAGHDEIVWESLVDVNGENSEFFSGDFRIVGGAHLSTYLANEPEWTTVSSIHSHNRHSSHAQSVDTSHVSQIASNEQEDHDLALALQLQDEEEERHRSEISRQHHEAELSRQYIEQGSRNVPTPTLDGDANRSRNRGPPAAQALRPAIPPRRNNTQAPNPPIDPNGAVDAPPPSYEQAATAPVYNPPLNHPAHPASTPTGLLPRQSSAYAANSVAYGTRSALPRPRNTRSNTTGSRSGGLVNEVQNVRRPGLTQQQQQDKDKDCIVM